MGDCDVHIHGLLHDLNLRFAPSEGEGEDKFGGVEEMAGLKKEFEIFKSGRPFHRSVAALNLGDKTNPRAKNRWFDLLKSLNMVDSSRSGLNGDEAIVDALVENLQSRNPKPVFFQAHDSRGEHGKKVVIAKARGAGYSITCTTTLPSRCRCRRANSSNREIPIPSGQKGE
jgi:hypothetical protein